MTVRRYLQLDVFADRPGAGNALGVVLDAHDLDAATMQAIAGWTHLSETVFLLPPSPGADYRVRIFTPRQELPFAGHPSVGAAWAALDQAIVAADAVGLVQDCAAGRLPVRVDPRDRTVHVRAPRGRPLTPAADHAPLLAEAVADLPLGGAAPALWSNGPSWWLVELRDGAAVRAMAPRLTAIAALTEATAAVGLAVYGAAGDDGREHGHDHDIVVRAFCPADGIAEDPVTGSANALVAAALHARGALPHADGRYVASQGRELGRDGRVAIAVDDDGAVWIGGRVQAVIRGTFDW